jgi:hypothetical protein
VTEPTWDGVLAELARLRRLEALVLRWRAAHHAHHRPETIREGDKGPRITRAEYLAAERALLELEGEP